MSVLLPSSTLPAVAKRSGCMERLEVALLLALLHRRLRGLVVHTGGAPLGEPRHHGLLDDRFHRGSARFDRAGAAYVAHGAEAHRHLLHRLALSRRRERRDRDQQAAAPRDGAAMREVDRGHLEALAGDVLPHVELGPVADREHAHVLAGMDPRVVQVPKLPALVARVPLAELVAEGEHALLGARLFLVAARAADRGVEAELADRL